MKFVQTASYVDALMLFGVRQHPALLNRRRSDVRAEARFGSNWLQQMWDDRKRVLYYQVGLGSGNDTILGDHDFWRLRESDDRLEVQPGDSSYYVKYRPVFRAGPPGSRISPNLAGRLAADFALCYQVFRDSAIFIE